MVSHSDSSISIHRSGQDSVSHSSSSSSAYRSSSSYWPLTSRNCWNTPRLAVATPPPPAAWEGCCSCAIRILCCCSTSCIRRMYANLAAWACWAWACWAYSSSTSLQPAATSLLSDWNVDWSRDLAPAKALRVDAPTPPPPPPPVDEDEDAPSRSVHTVSIRGSTTLVPTPWMDHATIA